MSSARHHLARRPTGRVLKAAPDYSVTSVLSWPGEDLSGDYVEPSGLDFTTHSLNPCVDLEHRTHPEVGDAVVGWARKSLHRPGGEYSVRWGLFDVGGGRKERLPVGTTYFDPNDRLQAQVYRMVAEGALPGVSLEFVPDWKLAKAVGWSELERRRAYRYPVADVHRWTICAQALCPNAQHVLSGEARRNPTAVKSLPPPAGEQVPPLLLTILSSQRVGSEALHPVVRKALAHHLPAKKYHRVGKAMNDDTDTVYDEAAVDPVTGQPAEESAEDAGPASNGVAALYAHAQALEAAADDLLADVEATDNPKLYQAALACVEKVKAMAEMVKGTADKHDAAIQAAKGKAAGDPEDETDEPDSELEEGGDAPDMTKDEDGTYKAVRGVYKPVLKAVMSRVRVNAAEVRKALQAEEDRARAEAERVLAEALSRHKKNLRRYAA